MKLGKIDRPNTAEKIEYGISFPYQTGNTGIWHQSCIRQQQEPRCRQLCIPFAVGQVALLSFNPGSNIKRTLNAAYSFCAVMMRGGSREYSPGYPCELASLIFHELSFLFTVSKIFLRDWWIELSDTVLAIAVNLGLYGIGRHERICLNLQCSGTLHCSRALFSKSSENNRLLSWGGVLQSAWSRSFEIKQYDCSGVSLLSTWILTFWSGLPVPKNESYLFSKFLEVLLVHFSSSFTPRPEAVVCVERPGTLDYPEREVAKT